MKLLVQLLMKTVTVGKSPHAGTAIHMTGVEFPSLCYPHLILF